MAIPKPFVHSAENYIWKPLNWKKITCTYNIRVFKNKEKDWKVCGRNENKQWFFFILVKLSITLSYNIYHM